MIDPISSEPRNITADEFIILGTDENGDKYIIHLKNMPVMRGTLDCETGILTLEPEEDA